MSTKPSSGMEVDLIGIDEQHERALALALALADRLPANSVEEHLAEAIIEALSSKTLTNGLMQSLKSMSHPALVS